MCRNYWRPDREQWRSSIYEEHAIYRDRCSADINISGASTFLDQGGNTFPGTAGNVLALAAAGTGTASPVLEPTTGSCSGTATSSTTLGLYNLGQKAALTCTSAVVNLGTTINLPTTAYGLYVTATHAGVSASSGVVTVLKNGSATALTCTIGTGTACQDDTFAHAVSLVQGDVISVQFTTQGSEVLAGVTATVFAPNKEILCQLFLASTSSPQGELDHAASENWRTPPERSCSTKGKKRKKGRLPVNSRPQKLRMTKLPLRQSQAEPKRKGRQDRRGRYQRKIDKLVSKTTDLQIRA